MGIHMWLNKLRILGSGFSKEEYLMYRLGELDNPDDAMRFLSNRRNHIAFRPAVNRSFQRYILEDKWVTQLYFASLGIPVPKAYGFYHPSFGLTSDGLSLRTPEQLATLLRPSCPLQLIIKPRVGSQGRDIILASFREDRGAIKVSADDRDYTLSAFVEDVLCKGPGDVESTQWIFQEHLSQNSFLSRINPYNVNTIRIVTFIGFDNDIQIHHSALRLGRKGGIVDNWSRGGFSVFIDAASGQLGRGFSKPRYGGDWVGVHPDTGAQFEGQIIPGWERVLDVCRRAAASLSDVRTVGWDVALTDDGPVIIEGNPVWGLPVVQIHTKGYLTDEVRGELEKYGAHFPDRLRPLPVGLMALLVYQWRRSRGPRIVNSWCEHMRRKFYLP